MGDKQLRRQLRFFTDTDRCSFHPERCSDDEKSEMEIEVKSRSEPQRSSLALSFIALGLEPIPGADTIGGERREQEQAPSNVD